MGYDADRAAYEQDCTETMIRMRDPSQSVQAVMRKQREETKALLRAQHETLRITPVSGEKS